MNKKSWIALLVLVVLVAAAAVCWFAFKPQAQAGEKTVTVEVTHTDGTVNTFVLKTDCEFLGQAMMEQQLLEGTQEQYGLFISSVDGEAADPAENCWWLYTKSGEYVEYGVDQCVIADGDHYEFFIQSF